jgi:serine/threonine-protein kinase HipA
MGSLLAEYGDRRSRGTEVCYNVLGQAHRYVSNINVMPAMGRSESDFSVMVDRLHAPLASFMTEFGEFSGNAEGLKQVFTAQDFQFSVNAVRFNLLAPRMSGLQVKVPGHLSEEGVLEPAINKSFTHIIKPACDVDGLRSSGSIEWFTMILAVSAGVETETFAIADLGGPGPTFIAERFDIPEPGDDSLFLTEDFWSIMGHTIPDQKFEGDLFDVADLVMKHCTDPAEDARKLLRQVIITALCGNNDLHLKNLMLLKKAKPDLSGFSSIRLAPAFDVMCTQVFGQYDAHQPPLTIGGSRQYGIHELRALGRKMEIGQSEVDELVTAMSENVLRIAPLVSERLPACVEADDESRLKVKEATALISHRCQRMLASIARMKPRPRV